MVNYTNLTLTPERSDKQWIPSNSHIGSFITLDPAYHEPFQVLPVGQIMAEWIIKDRIEKT